MTAKIAKREIYARLGVQLRNNRRAFKAERLAPGAMGLYAFMVMDARSELPELDGFVPEEVVLSAWGRPAEERSAQVEALCAVDLVERAEGGYVVVKYDEHNDTRAVVESNRKAAAKRMRHVRANKHRTSPEQSTNISRTEGECSPDVPYSSSYSPSGSDLGSRDRVVGPDGDSGVIFGAYVTGIREATGKPVTALSPAERRVVVDIANAHAEGRTGEALEAWVRETARDFARQHDATFGGFKPAQCAKWLDGGRKVRAGPAMRQHVQSSENRAWKMPPEMP